MLILLALVYTVILCAIMPPDCDSVSIRRGIRTAKQYLKSNGLPDLDMCKPESISALCANETEVVCAVRLVSKKMEFKQFDNSCYMDLNNICESQDNIWAIKNFGPCVMNPDLRRYANAIEKTEENDPNFEVTKENDDSKTENVQEDNNDDYGRKVVTAIKSKQNEPIVATTENAESVGDTTKNVNETDAKVKDTEAVGTKEAKDTNSKENAPGNTTDPVVDETTPVEDPAVTENSEPVDNMANGEPLRFGDDEIGKIFDADTGSVKPILRQESSGGRVMPMKGKKMSFDRRQFWSCDARVKPCPLIYLPMCVYYEKDNANKVFYYYFTNKCEAQQWFCYHPERPTNGTSSMRTSFCAHIQYLMYSRYMHAISSWMHYGWLHGPGRFNHMLKPHERAS